VLVQAFTRRVYRRYPWLVIGAFAILLPLVAGRAWLVLGTSNNNIPATMSAATFVPRLEPEPDADTRSRARSAGILGVLGRAVGASPERIERYALNSGLEDHRQSFIKQGYLEEARQQQLYRISARAAGQGVVDQAGFLDSVESRVETFLERKPSDWIAGVNVRYTGMVPLFFLAQRELLDGLFRSFLLAFVLIAVLMIVVLRSAGGGLLAMLPNLFPAAVVFGFMGHFAWKVDIGSMLTASSAMGIAVDDTVHFLTWFRRGLDQAMSRHDAVLYGWRRCCLLQPSVLTSLPNRAPQSRLRRLLGRRRFARPETLLRRRQAAPAPRSRFAPAAR
jgi:hypothetical protein